MKTKRRPKSKKSNTKKSNTKNFFNKLNEYVFLNDVGYKNDVDRKIIIGMINNTYISMYGESEYLDWLNNDILKIIGYLNELEDKKGVNLWNTLDKKMLTDKKTDKDKIESVLNSLPFVILTSFLGYTFYMDRIVM